MTTNGELFYRYEDVDRGGTGQGGVDPRREELWQKGSVDVGETAARSPEPTPEEPATAPDRSQTDPLLDLEVDKGGT